MNRPPSNDDWLGPDPFEVIEGFKQMPKYRCDGCWRRRPDVTDRYVFDQDSGFHEWKMYCKECWAKVQDR